MKFCNIKIRLLTAVFSLFFSLFTYSHGIQGSSLSTRELSSSISNFNQSQSHLVRYSIDGKETGSVYFNIYGIYMGGIWASNWDDSKRIRVKAIRTNRGNGLRTAMGDKYLYGKTQGPVKYYHSGFPEENDIIAIYNVTYPQKDKEVETLIGAITLASHNVPHVQDYNNGTLKLVPIDGPRH